MRKKTGISNYGETSEKKCPVLLQPSMSEWEKVTEREALLKPFCLS